jgi:hypothetical protein
MKTNTTTPAGQLELPGSTPEPGKTGDTPSASDFSEFLAAATSDTPRATTTGDAFDTIEAAAKIFHEQLEKLEAVFAEIDHRNPIKKGTEDDNNTFEYIKKETLEKTHDEMGDLLRRFYTENCLAPTGRIIGWHEPLETLCEAAQFEPSVNNKYPPLNKITAASLRKTFFQRYGDPVESRVQQLRQTVARYIGCHRRGIPELFNDRGVLSFYTGLYSESFLDPKKKTFNHYSEHRTDFNHLLRLCHFARTGEFIIPDENWRLKQPYGIKEKRPGPDEFDSATLFKRQIEPASGIKWLRFTASNRVEVLLEPKVETYFRALIGEFRNNPPE